jgi:hypothetical protein
MLPNKKMGVLLACLVLALGSSVWSRVPQKQTVNPNDKVAAENQKVFSKLDAELPIVDSTALEPSDPIERSKRNVKGKRYDSEVQRVAPELTRTMEVHDWPSDFSALPVTQSVAIVIARVSDARAYLSANKSTVYSEFTSQVECILRDTKNIIRPGQSIVSERLGGRVRFPSGFISRFHVAGFGMPQFGCRYLLFLEQVGDGGEFRILTGYELRDGHVIPLDESRGVVHFEKYEGFDEDTFVNTVKAAIAKESLK